jgi:hypothetical protein
MRFLRPSRDSGLKAGKMKVVEEARAKSLPLIFSGAGLVLVEDPSLDALKQARPV